MAWPPDFIKEVAKQIAKAEKDARHDATQADEKEKRFLLADADKLKAAYDALHGVGKR